MEFADQYGYFHYRYLRFRVHFQFQNFKNEKQIINLELLFVL